MAETLSTLIRLHEWTVDEKRRALGILLNELGALEDAARALEVELVAEQRAAAVEPEMAGFGYGFYALGVILRRERLADSTVQAEAMIETARDELHDAYEELKKFEITDASRRRRETDEADRVERIELDEIGLQGYRRVRAQDRSERSTWGAGSERETES
ncbi:MAG TPA: hypothetical protein QF804_09685 [Rhodospirillales bacterium]|nr:hypothetical protein [Rhodospirillales bacterium]HJO69933.1 hypothetical protein [Rhodospirillales bacterium]